MNVAHDRALHNSDIKNNRDLLFLYSRLLDYCHGNKTSCFPSVGTLMLKCDMPRRTVQLHLRELEQRGLILTLPRTTPTGRTTSNEYLMVGLMKVYEEMAAAGFDDEGRKKRKSAWKKSERPLKNSDQPASQTAHLGARKSTREGAGTRQVGAHAICRPLHEANCEAEKPTSNMSSAQKEVSLSVGEAAEIGHADVNLAPPNLSNPNPKPTAVNPKPTPVESVPAPIPAPPTVQATPQLTPAAPAQAFATNPTPVAPPAPAIAKAPQPAPQAPAPPANAPSRPPVLTPAAPAQAFAPRPTEPPSTAPQAPPRPAPEAQQGPQRPIERYQIQGEFCDLETCLRTFHEFVDKGWRLRSEDSFIAWLETWASVAAKTKQAVPEKKRVKNPKGYLVRLVKEGVDRAIIRQADVRKAQEVKVLLRSKGLYPSF